MNNCLLTGGTGILGSHILFEWIYKSFHENYSDHLYLIVRSKEKSAQERVVDILKHESSPAFLKEFSIQEIFQNITVIDSDLNDIKKEVLESYCFDYVIHCAGSTSLSHTNHTKEKVYRENLLVTKHLLAELPKSVKHFAYISTAYSFGIQDVKVNDSISHYNVTQFRNAYEESKYQSETFVRHYCESKQISPQILRPSIICGRLIHKPFYETPKYDVFYSWAMFLFKNASKSRGNFRIWIDKKSGLNIVPVDFVAKAILHATRDASIKELNIVNPKPILHKMYVEKVLQYFNINSYELMQSMPINLNVFESLYYKSIGAVFEKYISIPDLKFNSEAILNFIEELKLDKTLGVHENFMNLINFSVEKEFRRSY